MIYDDIARLGMYDPRFAGAADFLARCTPDMAPGRYEIDGNDMFAMIQAYRTKDKTEALPESHLCCIDIQTCLAGKEDIDFFAVPELTLKTEDRAKDMLFYEEPPFPGNRVEIAPGKAAVFYPHDAHRPGMHPASGPNGVKKVIIKIAVA